MYQVENKGSLVFRKSIYVLQNDKHLYSLKMWTIINQKFYKERSVIQIT